MTLMQGLDPGSTLAKNANDVKSKTSQKNLSMHLTAQAKSRKNQNKTAMLKSTTGTNSQSFVTSADLIFKVNQLSKPQRFNSSTPRDASQLHG